MRGQAGFPVGAAVTIAELEDDPHPALRRLREREPVSWLPALGGWLVTRRDLVLQVLRDSQTFTVADPRFSTARVVGPSMLSLDGAEHARHRDPFIDAFRVGAVRARLGAFVQHEADRLVAALAPDGRAELRRSLAGPLAVAVAAEVLGLGEVKPDVVLSWYDDIVAAVAGMAGEQGLPAGPAGPARDRAEPADSEARSGETGGQQAFWKLSQTLEAVLARPGGGSLLADVAAGGRLGGGEVVSNAAVLMFGGIETTEGMICNAVLHLLSDPGQARQVAADPRLARGAVEESLRLEPAAAVVDRYATADARLGGAAIRRGDLVTASLAGANRDPAVFPDPDVFDIRRGNAGLHVAFARGPHFCLGAHLAKLEVSAAILALLRQLPGLRLDPDRPQRPRGLVFRKPPRLQVLWDAPADVARWRRADREEGGCA
jgi:cytochrome P450